jgi:hypothetical protein
VSNISGTALTLSAAMSIPATTTLTFSAPSIIQATFTGYSEISVTDANWSQTASGGTATFTNSGSPFTFTATAGASGSAVYGYYIRTAPTTTGSVPRLLGFEVDTNPSAPYTMSSGNSYNITPSLALV